MDPLGGLGSCIRVSDLSCLACSVYHSDSIMQLVQLMLMMMRSFGVLGCLGYMLQLVLRMLGGVVWTKFPPADAVWDLGRERPPANANAYDAGGWA